MIIPDGWTSKARVGYYSTCAQYLDPSFRLQKMAVGFKDTQEKHTGENIANMIKDSFDQMGLTIHRDSVYVSDNASNMVKAAQVLEVFRLPCFAHTLNLSVKAEDCRNFSSRKKVQRVIKALLDLKRRQKST